MATIFIVFTNDGKAIAEQIQIALTQKKNRVQVISISQKMRGINPQPLFQTIDSSDAVVLLFTPQALVPNAREFENAFTQAVQQGKTIYPVQIDDTSLPNYVNLYSFQIVTDNQATIDDLVHDILRDTYPRFRWWRKLPFYGKALVGGLVVILSLLFAFFALFPDDVRGIFFCNLTNNNLPSCPTPTPTEIDLLPSETSSPTFTPTLTRTPTPTLAPLSGNLPQLLFAENFDDTDISQGLIIEEGDWIIVQDGINGAYQRVDSNSGYGEIRIGTNSWNNYALEFEVKFANLSPDVRAVINLRDQTPLTRDRIIFTLNVVPPYGVNELILLRVNQSDITPQELRSLSYSIQPNVWMRVKIEIQNDQVKVYLNDLPAPSLVGEITSNIMQGSVRLMATNHILFDNIRIWSR